MSLGVGTLNTNRKQDPVIFPPPGPPFDPASAENGVSVDGVSGAIVLGNDVGGTEAGLLSPREIPLQGQTIDISEAGTGNNVRIGPSPLDPLIFQEVAGNARVLGYHLNQLRIDADPDAPDITLAPEYSGGLFGYQTGGLFFNRIITLPPAVPGLFYRFVYAGNGVVSLQILPDGTDLIFFGIVLVTATIAGQGIETNVFSSITLACVVPGWWHNIAQTGAFTAI